MMKRDVMLLLLQVIVLILCTQARTKRQASIKENPDNHGKLFLLGFLEMDSRGASSKIYVTCRTMAELNIIVPFLNLTIKRYVSPRASTHITLPPEIRMRGLGRENKGVLLTSNVSVSVYATNARRHSRDAYVIFPTSTLGTEHFAITYTPFTRALVGVIALQDNTLVQIRLQGEKTNITYMGRVYKNGDLLRIVLNRLQTFQLQDTKDLTGTYLVSSGPVVVLGGNICAQVTAQITECSHLVTQLLPVSKWGKQFITAPVAGRKRGDAFRILAAYNDTTISIRGKKNFTLNSGELKEFKLTSKEARYIVCSKPAMLIQYNRGSEERIQSEPFALMVPPIEQYTNEYILAIPVPQQSPLFSNYISYIVNSSELGSILFNTSKFCKNVLISKSVPESHYTVLSCLLKPSLRVSSVVPISHTSEGGRFAVSMVGHTDNDAYGYLGGMAMRDVNCQRLFPKEMTSGDMVDNDCDGKIDEEIENNADDDGDGRIDEDTRSIITSCKIDSALSEVYLPKSEYLHGTNLSYSITNNSCEAIIKRTWNYREPNGGSTATAASQEIRWKKQRPTLIIPQSPLEELSDSETVRDMSTLCPGDRLLFNDTSIMTANGTKITQRRWIIQEDCGRVTSANQTIFVYPSVNGYGNDVKSSAVLYLILCTALGIPVVLLFLATCVIFLWKRHVTRTLAVTSVNIEVKEAKNNKWIYTNSHTIEECAYTEINDDLNHNTSPIQGKEHDDANT